VLWAAVSGASAQQQNTGSSKPAHRTIRGSSEATAPGLVNSDQGLSIIGAALESRKRTDSNTDCSNLVHAIYERAGFTYSYSNSSELYQGIKEFRRVLHPQPGDLVVWRGHVGIVISPVQHSFFSAMRSGRGVEFYDSPYWQARGIPRFFRHLRSASRTQFSASARSANVERGRSSIAESHDPVSANEDLALATRANTGPATGTNTPDLHKSESQTTGDAQNTTDGAKPKQARHTIQGPEDGVWEKSAVKPSPGIPFESVVTPTRPYEPPPLQSGFRTPNIVAKAAPATTKPPSADGPPVTESVSKPVQWAMSRYVPRPPWSLSKGRTSEPSIPRPPARQIPRPPQGSE